MYGLSQDQKEKIGNMVFEMFKENNEEIRNLEVGDKKTAIDHTIYNQLEECVDQLGEEIDEIMDL